MTRSRMTEINQSANASRDMAGQFWNIRNETANKTRPFQSGQLFNSNVLKPRIYK